MNVIQRKLMFCHQINSKFIAKYYSFFVVILEGVIIDNNKPRNYVTQFNFLSDLVNKGRLY